MADEGAVSVETWNSVYTEFRGEMTGKARRLLSDANIPASRLEAEDVVHNAFAKVLRAPRTPDNPHAYLYAVIRREVEAEARRCGPPAEWDAAHRFEAVSAGEPVLADFSDMVAHRIAVHQALSGLPPQQRIAVWATKAMGRTQQEAAEDMGRSAGTVATHVARAVACLKLNLVAVWAAVITLICGLLSEVAGHVTKAGSGGREPADPPAPDLGVSSWQAMLLGAVLLPLAFYALGSSLPWLKSRLNFGGPAAARPGTTNAEAVDEAEDRFATRLR
ncbi:sigma-70 family RNA polymerase sigma factor [Streptomyces sp. NBC_00989]|uniref:sigma-70 family RNA polymerase sigma factor n=1 Tax=Streptomyces sp. NBC_00989 TaxID=2903705 RepID=UPI00386F3114|nr:sigma-70 family RNA polymerase sigma factor [Streptomyces sp. NBC_00989]